MNDKQYVGDSVYLAFSGYGFTITTENGIEATNTIFLEPEVLKALIIMAMTMLVRAGATDQDLNAYGLKAPK